MTSKQLSAYLEARSVLVSPVEGRVLLLGRDALYGRHHRRPGILGPGGNGILDGGDVCGRHPTVADENPLGVPEGKLVEDVVDCLHLPDLVIRKYSHLQNKYMI